MELFDLFVETNIWLFWPVFIGNTVLFQRIPWEDDSTKRAPQPALLGTQLRPILL